MTQHRLSAALAGRYQIERELGQGGMATVYLGHDLRHDRDVAIKVLHPDLGAALGAERFLTEIKTTARLQHPHILPLLDSGDADGLLYYVMPLATGETLRVRLERERQLPLEDAVRIATEVADALNAAHALGIIHRDIKPENILLQGGHALVADFGIALAVQQAGGQRMTQTGLSLGTPQYMSPEQAMGDRAVDARSDIYALGAVCYEMLVGQPPFTGATVQTIVARVMTERPASIVAVRDTVPPTLEAAVLKALAKLPADRFATAAAFGAALGALATTTLPVRVEAAPSPRAKGPLLVGAVLAAATGLGAGWVLWSEAPNSGVVTGRITHVTAEDGLEVQPAISPDGRMMVYAAGTSLHVRLYLKPVTGGRAVLLTDRPLQSEGHLPEIGLFEDQGELEQGIPGSEQEPRWSPSGNSILFRTNRGVDTVAVGLGGGKPVTLISGTQGPIASATWSPDGREVAFVRHDSLMVYTIAKGATRFLAQLAGKECSWSPRNDWIACGDPRNFSVIGANMGNIGPSAILLVPVAGGDPVALTGNTTLNVAPVWSPDGERIYFISNRHGQRDIYQVSVGRDGRPIGEALRLTTALNVASLSLSRDGKRLAYSVYTPQANVWSVPVLPAGTATSAMATQVTFGHQVVESMSITPDGKTLLLDADRKGDTDIWRLDLEGKSEPEALTSDPVDEFGGVLSPDGRRLAYYAYPEGSGRGVIMVKPMEGGPAQRVNSPETAGIFPEWSPDGKTLIWSCHVRNRGGCQATQDGAGRWQVEYVEESRFNWSPDGRWSTHLQRGYWIRVPGDSLWIWPAEGGAGRLVYTKRASSDPSVSELQWGHDSKTLFFRNRDAAGRAYFWSLQITGGSPRLVARLDDPSRPSLRRDFATDGRRIFFTVNDRQSDISVVELIEP